MMKLIELQNEKLKDAIAGYLAALEALVRHRDALKLYDVNRHCEEVYGELLNEVLKRRHPKLRLEPADTFKHPNSKGIDLIDKKRKVIVQVTSSSTNDKVKHTFSEVNDPQAYDGFTLYFMFIAGKSEKIDLRKTRPPKFITCMRGHLLYPEDLPALLQGAPSRTAQKVLEILNYHLGDKAQMADAEQCLSFVDIIAELVKSTDHVRCMCKEFLQSGLGMKGAGLGILHRINHQVCHHIPDSLPDLEPIRHAWAKSVQIYGFLLDIEHLVSEIDCAGKDDIRYLDVHEVKKLMEELLLKIYSVIRYMSKLTGISEEVAFTELTIKANEY